MGFIAPAPPPVDVAEWKKLPHLARIKPLAQDWAINGFGTPTAIYLLYVVKLVVFSARRLADDLGDDLGARRTRRFRRLVDQPIVFQKIAVWLLLWEILGLGLRLDAPHLPLPATDRRDPLLAAPRHGQAAPVAGQGPVHAREPRRTLFDVAALRRGAGDRRSTCCSPDGEAVDRLRRRAPRPGRDRRPARVPRPARPARQGLVPRRAPGDLRPLLVIFLFPLNNLIVASQFVFLCIWLGAASSKLNRHFPFVVSVMISNTPLEPVAHGQGAALPRSPRGPAAVAAGRARRAPGHGDRVHPADPPVLRAARADRHARGRSG